MSSGSNIATLKDQQQESLLRGEDDDGEERLDPKYHDRSAPTVGGSKMYASLATVMENNILTFLMAVFFFFIGVLNIIQYIIWFSTNTIGTATVDQQLMLSFSVTDLAFYVAMVLMSVFLIGALIASGKQKWKAHLALMILYTLSFIGAMLFSIASMSLSIALMARNGQVGFAILRTMILAAMFCFFCALLNCMFLPAKFRQSRREIDGNHNGSSRGDYSML